MDNGARMAIACSSCAKAKAKCDKKFPCTRCASKHTPCQSRSARRSFNVASRRANPVPDASGLASTVSCASRISKGTVEAGSSIVRRAKEKERQLQWTTYPTSPSLSGYSSPSGKRHDLTKSSHLGANLSNQTDGLTYGQDAEQELAHRGLSESPLHFDVSLTPVMHPMSEVNGFMQVHGGDYSHECDDQFLLLEGMHNPLDFDMSILTEMMSPDSTRYEMAEPSIIETMPGTSGEARALPRVSISTTSNYSSRNGSTSSMSLPESPQTSHKRPATSICQQYFQEHEAVTAAQEGWPCFRCNPPIPTLSCPKTAKLYLEGLEQTLRNQDTWTSWDTRPDLDRVTGDEVVTECFVGCTRDKLLAITQSFLHKALEIHRARPVGSPESLSISDLDCAQFIILPPPEVLEFFLRAYVCRFEPYYGFVSGGILKPNEIMQLSNGKASSLLLLLMVAQGAMATSTAEARYLTSGLTEACRISLFDIIEKDIVLSSDPIVLRCALLFTTLAAWSGDKWHMDIAMGQRGIYMAMLTHAGMLESRQFKISLPEEQVDVEAAWTGWKEHESRSRLVYSWVTNDQELSLFHEVAPMLSVTNLDAAMPDTEFLWQAKSAHDWYQSYQRVYGMSPRQPRSLRDLFRRLIDGELLNEHAELSPIQLRLLLHPLQSLVCHLRQFLSCFSEGGNYCKASQAVTKSATRARLEEIQCLLQQWYALSRRSIQDNVNHCSAARANIIMYHLISLNTMTCFPDIERLARCEVTQPPLPQSWRRLHSGEEVQEVLFHCGQILRETRSMPERVRPPWWAAAVYRVALISWANSMANAEMQLTTSDLGATEGDQSFAIDDLPPEHPYIVRYLKHREGLPMFSKPDGSMVSLEVPEKILRHCIDLIEENSTMRFTAGIQSKLVRLAERWKTCAEVDRGSVEGGRR